MACKLRNSDKQTWEPAESFVGDVQRDWLEYNRRRGVDVSMSALAKKAGVRSMRMRLDDGLPFSMECALCRVLLTGESYPELERNGIPPMCAVCGCE